MEQGAIHCISCFSKIYPTATVQWFYHSAVQPDKVVAPVLSLSNALALGDVECFTPTDVVWFSPNKFCWLLEDDAASYTSLDASPQDAAMTNVAISSCAAPTWIGSSYGTVPDAEVLGSALAILHAFAPPKSFHAVDATVIGYHQSTSPYDRVSPSIPPRR